ncbi:uncharacterized protein I303_100104 [Kwoniella dejecticola CBS 10117]|uniref:Uncharacterized protein n=1 Tax=Kwoniella dejecticola CBS 10117 TaxID=1296121 RepID=A0A1A6AE42_9TREE|nr:uncharacterized protein I303_00104 [Kwoniella dejecticola CBS 10117]OBR88293.1 hypothetical protein I303_00104 [Kwoniella dejecticola CBS 10117]
MPAQDPREWKTYVSNFYLTTIAPLAPVHHMILDNLVAEKSVALGRTAKRYYDVIIPSLYHHLVIDEQNFDKVFYGLTDEVMEPPKSQEASESRNAYQCFSPIYKIGQRKWELLKKVKNLTFVDSYSAERFFYKVVEEFNSVFFRDWYGIEDRKKDFGRIFETVQHLKFGSELIVFLDDEESDGDENDMETRENNRIRLLTAMEDLLTKTIDYCVMDKYQKDKLQLRFHVHPDDIDILPFLLGPFVTIHKIVIDVGTFLNTSLDPNDTDFIYPAAELGEFMASSNITCLLTEDDSLPNVRKAFEQLGFDEEFRSQLDTTSEKEFICPCSSVSEA